MKMSNLMKKKSSINGIGVFTDRFIQKDSVFYEVPMGIVHTAPRPKWAHIGENRWVCDEKVLNYINHSCSSNTVLDISGIPKLIAKRNIYPGEEITVNYNETEAHQCKINCTCASLNCNGFFFIQHASSMLFLGDSYTEGTGVRYDKTYPYLLSKKLGTVSMDVLAKHGWSSTDLINNLREIEHKNYDYTYLLIGVNDFCDSIPNQDILKNMGLLYESIKRLSKQIVILTIPDFTRAPNAIKYGDLELNQTNLTDLNVRITSTFSQKCAIIDIFSVTKTLTQNDFYTKDGIHPSEKQYELWVDRILEEV